MSLENKPESTLLFVEDTNFDNSAICKDCEGYCSKCGGARLHTIFSVSQGHLDQVECKTCHNVHKFKPLPEKDLTSLRSTKTFLAVSTHRNASPTRTTTRSTSTATGSSSTREPKAPKSPRTVEPKAITSRVMHNGGETKTYSLKGRGYQVGDRICHPKYGIGIVEEISAPGKMLVAFEFERVGLIYGK